METIKELGIGQRWYPAHQRPDAFGWNVVLIERLNEETVWYLNAYHNTIARDIKFFLRDWARLD